jgi:hypothetical protein
LRLPRCEGRLVPARLKVCESRKLVGSYHILVYTSVVIDARSAWGCPIQLVCIKLQVEKGSSA